MTNMPPVLPRDRTVVVRHLWVACTEPGTHLERALGELLVPDLALNCRRGNDAQAGFEPTTTATYGKHGARPILGKSHADAADGQDPSVQAVRRERVIPPLGE